MKRSQIVKLTILTSLALSAIACEEANNEKHCIDSTTQKVVPDENCKTAISDAGVVDVVLDAASITCDPDSATCYEYPKEGEYAFDAGPDSSLIYSSGYHNRPPAQAHYYNDPHYHNHTSVFVWYYGGGSYHLGDTVRGGSYTPSPRVSYHSSGVSHSHPTGVSRGGFGTSGGHAVGG